jgi:hypothetical protein
MPMLRLTCFLFALLFPVGARAAEQVLFEIPVEMNRNAEQDRAMLVIVGDTINIEEGKPLDFYQLEDGQRADLLIFLDVGDDALNITDTPTFRKQGIALREGLNFIMVPEAKGKGSLNIITANGFGNTFNTTETLSIVYRDGVFRVGGWAQDLYNSREEESAHCSINYLSGKAVKRGTNGKNIATKGKFKPVLLADWKVDDAPNVCGD